LWGVGFEFCFVHNLILEFFKQRKTIY